MRCPSSKGLRPIWWPSLGTGVPSMGIRGCGYGILVSVDGATGPWIWEKGGGLWEHEPGQAYGSRLWDCLKVPIYGQRLVEVSGRSAIAASDRRSFGSPLWDHLQVTRYGPERRGRPKVYRPASCADPSRGAGGDSTTGYKGTRLWDGGKVTRNGSDSPDAGATRLACPSSR